jgi:L,D-transpeptidase YcbB
VSVCDRFNLILIACAFTAAGCAEHRRAQTADPELEAILLAPAAPDRSVAPPVWKDTQSFYARREYSPAWIDKDQPGDQLDAVLDVIRTAERHGLRTEHYGLDAIERERAALAGKDERPDRQQLASFDVRVTMALLALGRDVALGRQSPEPKPSDARRAPDLAGTLSKAAADGALHLWLTHVRPAHKEYAALQQALAALRAREEAGGWPVVPRAAMARQAEDASIDLLRQRLTASGELTGDRDLVQALQSFQNHHGLKATGTLDARTLAEMNVPLAARIRQIEINLERWRSMPDDLGTRHIRVNIPRFYLEVHEEGRPALEMRVVVGKRGDETPTLSSTMTHVVLSPFWNIPGTIAADETLPAIERDPAYLRRNNIEVVRRSRSRAEVVDPTSIDWDDANALEHLSFRQRPGSANALGLVKFMFPNRFSVYIHDTPADALFARVGRSFSHGCVRIEDPVRLAKYVLRDQPEWTEQALYAAMHAGVEKHARLTTPIPVHIVYFTAWVDERGGLHFRDDVYGYEQEQGKARSKNLNTAVVGRGRRIG